jgi:hypothetical protein
MTLSSEFEEGGRKWRRLNSKYIYQGIFLEGLRKFTKTTSRIAIVPAGILTGHFPD